MDKIMELLKKIGASDDFANQLCEELGRFDKAVHEKYETQYKDKMAKAKQVCLEEVEKYKLELARKVEIFLESKSSEIERSIDQRKAAEETEATGKLRRVREVTEGIEVADDAEVKAMKEQVRKLTTQTQTLTEEKTRAEEAANRANAIAMDVIREHKAVLAEGTKPAAPVAEGAAAPKKDGKPVEEKPIVEGADKNRAAIREAIRERRLHLRKPETTRKTLQESQDLAGVQAVTESAGSGDAVASIASIAQTMPEY